MSRLEQLLQFHQESPDDSFVTFAIAKEYETGGDWDQALAYYLRLLETDPGYVGAYYHLGKLYERRGEWEAALRTFESGMTVAQRAGDRHAWSELAGAKLNLEDE